MSALHPCSLRSFSRYFPIYAILNVNNSDAVFSIIHFLFFIITYNIFFMIVILLVCIPTPTPHQYHFCPHPIPRFPPPRRKNVRRRIPKEEQASPLVNKRRKRTAVFLDSKVWPENLMLEVMITQREEKQSIKVPEPRKFNIHYRFLSQGSVE